MVRVGSAQIVLLEHTADYEHLVLRRGDLRYRGADIPDMGQLLEWQVSEAFDDLFVGTRMVLVGVDLH